LLGLKLRLRLRLRLRFTLRLEACTSLNFRSINI
jgi:hypothetical protein